MNIADWLQGLGLSQYASAFEGNAIDADLLPKLSADDLKEIGVLPLGHRIKLLEAIAQLRSNATRPAHSVLALYAERRPITVMFCDLADSTSLAAKLDAEDWRDLVGGYLDEASKAIHAFGGYVLKKMGDGNMALFGYPKALENDAERAARAGLAILRRLEDFNAGNVALGRPPLGVRIGLDSGPVVVDATGEVYGDTPNIAARVESVAEPGTLLVTSAVQRQIAGLFVAEDMGTHELRGVAGRQTLWRIVRASGGGRRAGARSLTAFVGREDELATLQRQWERARACEGRLLLIVGEPGMGKSRLMDQFRAKLMGAPHTWVEWGASQLLQNTPLHPILEWGGRQFVGERRLAEFEATLALLKLDPAEHVALLAPLFDLAVPPLEEPTVPLENFSRRQLEALAAWMLASARLQPAVLAFEDLHWADPTTLNLLATLAERCAKAPLLIVATTRPEFRAQWPTRSHHGTVSLVPLDNIQVRTMVAAIAARHSLTNDVVEGVSERTGGVPLFIEEVTRLMLEGGVQTIPPTLQQSLAARLDRLGDAREVAQIGAVLGREFSYSLLQAVAGAPAPALDAALEKLADADLLFVEGVAPNLTFRFKHALIQDAAYESQLRARRQTLHRAAAQALCATPDPQAELVAHHFTQSGQTESAIEWWGKAGDSALRRNAFQEAISHLGKAIEMADRNETMAKSAPPLTERSGDDVQPPTPPDGAADFVDDMTPNSARARALHASLSLARRLHMNARYLEAHDVLALALEGLAPASDLPAIAQARTLLAELEETDAFLIDRRNRALKTKYAQAVLITRGHTADATKAAFDQVDVTNAQRLAVSEQVTTFYGRWTHALLSGPLRPALAIAQSVLDEGEASNRRVLVATAHRWISYTRYYLGELAASRDHAEKALRLYDERWVAAHDVALGFDFLCGAHLCLALPLSLLGEVDSAAAQMELALRRAHETGQPFSIAQGYIRDLQRLWLANRPQETLRAAEKLNAIRSAKGVGAWDLQTRLFGSWASGRLSNPVAGAIAVREAWVQLQEHGERLSDARALIMLADLATSGGAFEEALAHVDEGLSIVAAQGAAYALAPLHRIRADALALRDPSSARAAYLESIRIAREQGARTLQLQAALPLARLFLTQNAASEARDVLFSALRGFSATPELPAIAEAQALLATLQPD